MLDGTMQKDRYKAIPQAVKTITQQLPGAGSGGQQLFFS